MLEIATEDQGWVHEAAKFASRLLRDSDEQSRQRAVTNALMELLSANLIEIGESKNNSFRPLAELELNRAMIDPQTWAFTSESSSPELIYIATDEGCSVNQRLDRTRERTSAWVYD